MMRDDIRIRLRHVWVTIMSISDRCQLEYAGRPAFVSGRANIDGTERRAAVRKLSGKARRQE